jgi:branched-subunit amino acid transport protein
VGTRDALILIAGMTVATYLTRVPLFLLAVRPVRLPSLLDRVLEQIPIAAFAAIVFPAVLQPEHETNLHPSNLYLYAAAVTVAVALALRRSVLAAILAGVASATVLRLVVGS